VESASELAKAFNRELRGLAERLNVPGDEDEAYGFWCEDGCGGAVALTLAAYLAAGGAWLDGHDPEQP
jgi:hypothetical protein